MRELEINKQTIYYATYTSKTDAVNANNQKTGDKTKSYATPVAKITGFPVLALLRIIGISVISNDATL